MDQDEPRIHKPANLDVAQVDELRYWQSRPMHERMARVAELSLALYGLKDPPKLDKTLVRFERPQR